MRGIDFSLTTYKVLLSILKDKGYTFYMFSDFISTPLKRIIVLRHDVDKQPGNSLDFARIQADSGITGSYFFRGKPGSWDEEIIRKIAGMGHEVGYHYEDLSETAQRYKGKTGRGGDGEKRRWGEEIEKELVEIAIQRFSENLEKLRKIVPVKTICMHGSPMSRWDSRMLWKYYDYHDFGIIGEPYFDVDFDEVLYLTDTGRRWDGNSVNIRDKAQSSELRVQGENPYINWKVKPFKYRENMVNDLFSPSPPPALSPSSFSFHSTFDIINAAEKSNLPDKIMMTFHPQRWSDRTFPWVKELMWQNVKNVAKFILVRSKKQAVSGR